jgi:hypothetical protein
MDLFGLYLLILIGCCAALILHTRRRLDRHDDHFYEMSRAVIILGERLDLTPADIDRAVRERVTLENATRED